MQVKISEDVFQNKPVLTQGLGSKRKELYYSSQGDFFGFIPFKFYRHYKPRLRPFHYSLERNAEGFLLPKLGLRDWNANFYFLHLGKTR